jgi:hypothetical protein
MSLSCLIGTVLLKIKLTLRHQGEFSVKIAKRPLSCPLRQDAPQDAAHALIAKGKTPPRGRLMHAGLISGTPCKQARNARVDR